MSARRRATTQRLHGRRPGRVSPDQRRTRRLARIERQDRRRRQRRSAITRASAPRPGWRTIAELAAAGLLPEWRAPEDGQP